MLVLLMVSLTCHAAVLHTNSMQQCLSKWHAATPHHTCMQHCSLAAHASLAMCLLAQCGTASDNLHHTFAYCSPQLFCIQSKHTCHEHLLSQGMADVLLCVVLCWCIQATLAGDIHLSGCQSDDFEIPCQSCTVCFIAASCSLQARV